MAPVINVRARAHEARDAIELLSNKWCIAILHVLAPGPLRTSVLQRGLSNVSPKMLSQTLRSMERDGLVERSVFSEARLHVEYQLTEMGRSVLAPLSGLCHWARAHSQMRETARRRFDLLRRKAAHQTGEHTAPQQRGMVSRGRR